MTSVFRVCDVGLKVVVTSKEAILSTRRQARQRHFIATRTSIGRMWRQWNSRRVSLAQEVRALRAFSLVSPLEDAWPQTPPATRFSRPALTPHLSPAPPGSPPGPSPTASTTNAQSTPAPILGMARPGANFKATPSSTASASHRHDRPTQVNCQALSVQPQASGADFGTGLVGAAAEYALTPRSCPERWCRHSRVPPPLVVFAHATRQTHTTHPLGLGRLLAHIDAIHACLQCREACTVQVLRGTPLTPPTHTLHSLATCTLINSRHYQRRTDAGSPIYRIPCPGCIDPMGNGAARRLQLSGATMFRNLPRGDRGRTT